MKNISDSSLVLRLCLDTSDIQRQLKKISDAVTIEDDGEGDSRFQEIFGAIRSCEFTKEEADSLKAIIDGRTRKHILRKYATYPVADGFCSSYACDICKISTQRIETDPSALPETMLFLRQCNQRYVDNG